MRVGVVGLGYMGATHLRAWRNVDGTELAAIASSSESKRRGVLDSVRGNLDRDAASIELGSAARYSTAEALIADTAVDAVDLCTPTFLHADQATHALQAGKHVLVEKPMSATDADCRRMLDAARASGRVLMVGQVLRYWPDYVAALHIIRSGSLGALLSVHLRRKCGAPCWSPWLQDKSQSGGAILDLLIHDFDFCRHLVGMPASVQATGVDRTGSGIDVVEARLDYGPGAPQVVVSGGWHHPESYPFSMEFTLVCEEGSLDFHSGDHRLTLYRADGTSELVAVPEGDAFEAQLAAFARACGRGSAPPECDPQESADAVSIARAADRSRASNGEPTAPEGSSA